MVNGLAPAQFTVAEHNTTYDLSGRAGPLMEIMPILQANNIPLNHLVDLRSNPAVSQQVAAVIRRAAVQPQALSAPAKDAPASVVAASAFAPPQPSVARRLQELETLRDGGAISEAEYTRKREKIIAEI